MKEKILNIDILLKNELIIFLNQNNINKEVYNVFKGGNLFYNYYKNLVNINEEINKLIKISDYDFHIFTNIDTDNDDYKKICMFVYNFLKSIIPDFNKFIYSKFTEYISINENKNLFIEELYNNFKNDIKILNHNIYKYVKVEQDIFI
jgi:hypothetical protein